MNRISNQIAHRARLCLGQNKPVDEIIRYYTRRMASTQREEVKTPANVDEKPKGPLKFTVSEAYINYKSIHNFHGGDDRDLPKTHNLVVACTGIFAFFYLIFLRDDIEADGGTSLFQPLHESIPDMAIPLIESAIAENRKFGYNTEKLEKKLSELMKEPEKHGGYRRKLIEN